MSGPFGYWDRKPYVKFIGGPADGKIIRNHPTAIAHVVPFRRDNWQIDSATYTRDRTGHDFQFVPSDGAD